MLTAEPLMVGGGRVNEIHRGRTLAQGTGLSSPCLLSSFLSMKTFGYVKLKGRGQHGEGALSRQNSRTHV